MKKLELEFEKSGFIHKRVFLDYPYAIYKRWNSNEDRAHYETILIRELPESEMFGNIVPARESYPGNEKWGIDAFTSLTFEAAMKRVEYFKKRKEMRQEKEDFEEPEDDGTALKAAVVVQNATKRGRKPKK
jgi:hypothetical protein